MRLDEIQIPGEAKAEERGWQVARAAYESRAAVPHRRRAHGRALVLVGAMLALAGAIASPPGRAVLGSVRHAIGEEQAVATLTRLPAGGRLVVESSSGPWLVSADGSKRLLADFAAAAWSPFGRFVVATRPDGLAALEPDGRVRWSLARPSVRFARWGGTRTDTRIAFLTGSRLHVVAGDGTGDVDACGEPAAAPVAPAWRPGAGHVLAYADTRGRITVLDVDRCSLRWRAARRSGLRSLRWSDDGDRLLAVTRAGLVLLGAGSARPLGERLLRGVTDARFEPRGRGVAVARGREVLLLDGDRLAAPPRRLFAGAGGFTDLAWSPNGRWLLVAWASADQWLFLRADGSGRVHAVGSIAEQFGGGAFPRLGEWCCPS